MRRSPLLAVLAMPLVAAAAETKVAPAVVKGRPTSTITWNARGGWDKTAFNRSVQIDEIGRSAFRMKGRYSLEVVGAGEKGDVELRFFDASGAPVAQVTGHVRGIGERERGLATRNPAAAGQWSKSEKWSDAGFDAASPFATRKLADGSVRVELRSSKHQGLFIEATLPAIQVRTR